MIARHIIFICISRVAISVHFISDNKLEMKTDISLNEKLLNEAKVGWSDAISTTSKWYKFRSDEGKDLCDKLDEITATINLVLSQPKTGESNCLSCSARADSRACSFEECSL